MLHTKVVIVDDSDPGPIEELNEVEDGLCQEVIGREEVHCEGKPLRTAVHPGLWVRVHAGLHYWDTQTATYRSQVRAQEWIRRADKRRCSKFHLVTG